MIMMEPRSERRRCPRRTTEPPLIGILYTNPLHFFSSEDSPKLFVDIANRGDAGVLVRSESKIDASRALYLRIYEPQEKSWTLFEGSVVWSREDGDYPGSYLLGLEVAPAVPSTGGLNKETSEERQKPAPGDYEFFRRIRMLRFLSRNAVCPVLNRVFHRRIKKGERFIRQGEPGDAFYVIQRGTCEAIVEKNGDMHPVARLHEGEIVGEMAILTGEPRSSHVEAETDMEIWGLSRTDFEEIERRCPDMRTFLTELVADRFASREITADRRIGKHIISDIVARGGNGIVYGDEDQQALKRLLEEFTRKLCEPASAGDQATSTTGKPYPLVRPFDFAQGKLQPESGTSSTYQSLDPVFERSEVFLTIPK